MARRTKNDDEPLDDQDPINNDSDETFGLPEVEYEPLRRDEPVREEEAFIEPEPAPVPPPERIEERVEEPVMERHEEPVIEPVNEEHEVREESTAAPVYAESHHVHEEENQDYASSYHYEPEKPVWPKVLGIILLVLLAGGAIYYFAVYQPAQREAKAQELRDRRAAELEAKRKRDNDAAEAARRDAEQRRADSLANVPKVGALEMLSKRTGQYHVVVASAIDDDLLMDYANKLVKDGKTVKIIPPFGRRGKFYRLAVESKGSYADAQASADGLKGGEYGDQLWVMRY